MLDFLNSINDVIWTYILIAVLLALGLFFSIKTNFVQFRYFGEMFRLLTDKATITTEGRKGISSFQAFCISTASRVGTGNLAGVATAITLGGPGAVFWMWLIAFLGGASSFIESTLAQVYKVKDRDGYRGGPAYYMERGLKNRKLGIVFAVIITFCFGLVFNSVQSNTISMAFNSSFDISAPIIGVVLVVLTALVIFGGVKRIAHVVQVIVPVMALAYLILAVYVVVINFTEIPTVFRLIIGDAFGLEQAVGGGMGAAILYGVKRGLFSNEAGMGSAPNAAASAAVSHPVKQGLIQTLGVFTDTLFICSATAFIILLSGTYASGAEGINLTQMYRIAVLGMVMWGSIANLTLVWTLADIFMGIMALINLMAIALLYKVAVKALNDYREQRKQGKDPVFNRDCLDDPSGIEYWHGEIEQK